jgi:N-sulfoglucosamine sulfohydrolase
MNIIYLHSHDTGRYIQPYGYGVSTPHLQRFAQTGVLYRHAFTVNPTCSPSRAALLTGTWPHVNGMLGLAHLGSRLRDPSMHLASFLRSKSYHAVLCGHQHETAHKTPQDLGYESVIADGKPNDPYHDANVADAAASFLATALTDRPFFLAVGFHTTHRIGKADGEQTHNIDGKLLGDPRYVRPPSCLPDTPETRADFADYAVAVNRLDDYMGRVIAALESSAHKHNTLLVITTDHGIAFPHMKCNLTDHGTGVMLMLRGPGFEGGKVIDTAVTHMDVFPTICDLARIEKPTWLAGKSLVPTVDHPRPTLHDHLFFEVNHHAAPEPMRAVRTARWKYIRRHHTTLDPVMRNSDPCHSMTYLVSHGWPAQTHAREELYDLIFDPAESRNLATHPDHQSTLAELRTSLDDWMHRTNDPLLTTHC